MVDAKLSKEARHTLNQALLVLENAMELALQKEDVDAMIGISDRLMMLYQHLTDRNAKKFKPGFGLGPSKEDLNESSESD